MVVYGLHAQDFPVGAGKITSTFSCSTLHHACYKVTYVGILCSTAIFIALVCIKKHAVFVRRLIVIRLCVLAFNMVFVKGLFIMGNGGLCAR